MQKIGGTFLALLMLFAGTQILVSGQESENIAEGNQLSVGRPRRNSQQSFAECRL